MSGLTKMILSRDQNGLIGLNSKIPWYLPSDLKRFRRVTESETVIMGRKTFLSIGGRALINRRNIVITKEWREFTTTYPTPEGSELLFLPDLQTALVNTPADQVAWIIGGAVLYRQAINHVSEVCLTEVQTKVVVNPEKDSPSYFNYYFSPSAWQIVNLPETKQSLRDEFPSRFYFYQRIP